MNNKINFLNNDLFNFLAALASLSSIFKPLLRGYVTLWMKGALRENGFDYKKVRRVQRHVWYVEAQPNAAWLQEIFSIMQPQQFFATVHNTDLATYEQQIMEYNEKLATAIHQSLLKSGMYFVVEVRPFFRWKKNQASAESIFRFSIGIGASIEYEQNASANPSLSYQFQPDESYYSDEEYDSEDLVYENYEESQEGVYA